MRFLVTQHRENEIDSTEPMLAKANDTRERHGGLRRVPRPCAFQLPVVVVLNESAQAHFQEIHTIYNGLKSSGG